MTLATNVLVPPQPSLPVLLDSIATMEYPNSAKQERIQMELLPSALLAERGIPAPRQKRPSVRRVRSLTRIQPSVSPALKERILTKEAVPVV